MGRSAAGLKEPMPPITPVVSIVRWRGKLGESGDGMYSHTLYLNVRLEIAARHCPKFFKGRLLVCIGGIGNVEGSTRCHSQDIDYDTVEI